MKGLTGIIVVVVIVIAVFWVLKLMRRSKLRKAYNNALMGTDKVTALNLGRAYYATFNKGNVVTPADEIRISNELSTMKV